MDLFCIISYSVVSRDKCCVCVCTRSTRQIPKVVMSVREKEEWMKITEKRSELYADEFIGFILAFFPSLHLPLPPKCFIMILLGHSFFLSTQCCVCIALP